MYFIFTYFIVNMKNLHISFSFLSEINNHGRMDTVKEGKCGLNWESSIETYTLRCIVTKSCLPLCDPMNYSMPGSTVHGIFQARIMEWVAISFSRGSSQPRYQTCISCIGRRIIYHWATWEAHFSHRIIFNISNKETESINKYFFHRELQTLDDCMAEIY